MTFHLAEFEEFRNDEKKKTHETHHGGGKRGEKRRRLPIDEETVRDRATRVSYFSAAYKRIWRFLPRGTSYRVVKVKKRVIRSVASFIHGGAREESRSSLSRVSKKGIISLSLSLSYPPWPAYYSPARKRQRGRRISTLYLFTGRCARTLARRYTQKDDEPRGRAQKDYRGGPRPPISRFPRASASYQECGYLSGCCGYFFHLLIVLPWIPLGTHLLRGLHLIPSVLRMLPTRFNGGLVRACTRLLRLLAATRCSWHSYLNVISMFLRTARSLSVYALCSEVRFFNISFYPTLDMP